MKKKLIILPFILTFLSLLYSEEIGNLFYHGDIGELKDSTIAISKKGVSFSKKVKVILSSNSEDYVVIPQMLTINGFTTGDSPWQEWNVADCTFIFDEYFPLTGDTSNFNYKIDYILAKDSILPNGDTIGVIVKCCV